MNARIKITLLCSSAVETENSKKYGPAVIGRNNIDQYFYILGEFLIIVMASFEG